MVARQKNQLAYLVILLAAGIAIGWMLRIIPWGDAELGGVAARSSCRQQVPGASEPGKRGGAPSVEAIEEQLAAVLQRGNVADRRLAVRAVFAELEAGDLRFLLVHVETISEEMDDGWFLADEFYRRWGELAPRDALEFLKGHQSYWAGMRGSVWSAWARTHPGAAIAAYDPSMEEQHSRELQEAILKGLCSVDPGQALRFADAQEMGHDGIFTPENRNEILERNAISRELLDYVPVERPYDSFGLTLYSWIHRDPEGALQAMLPLQHYNLRKASLNALFSNWIMRDPDAALGALNRIKDLDLRESTAHTAMQAYLFRRPREAFERLVKLPNFAEEGAGNDPFAGGDPFAEDDPFGSPAPVKLRTRPFTYRMSLISEAAASLGIKEGRTAWDAAAAIEDDNKRAAALSGALAGWLTLDPEGAAEFAAKGIEQGTFEGPDFPGFAARLVGKMLAQHDFQQAADWVDALPAGPLREGAIKTSAQARLSEAWDRALAEASPEGWVNPTAFQDAQNRGYAPVIEWLASMPPSKGRDGAAFWLVHRLGGNDDPRRATQWAATIEDPRTRRISFEGIAREIRQDKKQDNEAAGFEAWSVAHPELAADLRQALVQKRDGEGDGDDE